MESKGDFVKDNAEQKEKSVSNQNTDIDEEFNKTEELAENKLEDQEDLGEKDTEIRELADRFLRLQADFINYKNRVEKDKEKVFAYATESIIVELLPVLDNFDRALKSVKGEDKFYQGVKMIYEQILETLNRNGLKEIESIGKPFDPNFHHAVFVEKVEGKEEGIILDVLQKGYLLEDKVIRPSMVKVAE